MTEQRRFERAGAATGKFVDDQIAKANDWIDRNVPKHTAHEYRELLLTNQALGLKLVQTMMQNEDLKEALWETQKEAVEAYPQVPFRVTHDAFRDVMRPCDVHRLTWDIEPHRAQVAVSDEDKLMFDARPRIREAFREFFHREIVPSLWAQTEAVFMRSTTR